MAVAISARIISLSGSFRIKMDTFQMNYPTRTLLLMFQGRLYWHVSAVAHLSFAVFVVSMCRQLVEYSQQMEGLLGLECEQVQIHQEEAHGLSKPLF